MRTAAIALLALVWFHGANDAAKAQQPHEKLCRANLQDRISDVLEIVPKKIAEDG
jgi:hypothetical protein